jgi:hypothetical protein
MPGFCGSVDKFGPREAPLSWAGGLAGTPWIAPQGLGDSCRIRCGRIGSEHLCTAPFLIDNERPSAVRVGAVEEPARECASSSRTCKTGKSIARFCMGSTSLLTPQAISRPCTSTRRLGLRNSLLAARFRLRSLRGFDGRNGQGCGNALRIDAENRDRL